jgi:hypothetical protein
VSCADDAHCVAVGFAGGGTTPQVGAIAGTSDGTHWLSQTVPSGVTELNGVSCADATHCVAVGLAGSTAAIVATTDGADWVTQTAPPGVSFLANVSCATVTDCVAVGYMLVGGTVPFIVATTDGSDWVSQTVPAGVGQLLGVSCPNSTHCFAVGIGSSGTSPAVLATTDGSTWTAQSAPSSPKFDRSISCVDTTHCVAVGEDTTTSTVTPAAMATTDGATWVSESVPNTGDGLTGVSCGSTTHCFTVGSEPLDFFSLPVILATTDGSTWAGQLIPEFRFGSLDDISCVDATHCFAVGGGVVALKPVASTVVVPSSGATVGGTKAVLDATASATSGVASVEFALTTLGSITYTVIGTATPTPYGYILFWDTTSVPNGNYLLLSLVTDGDGDIAFSPAMSFTVNHSPPSTAVVIPSAGATLQGGSAVLDATASAPNGVGIAQVQFTITGGFFNQTVIGTATPTLYGYLFAWNTTDVPNGTYTLQSTATDVLGNTAFSAGTSVTVANAPPTTTVLIPSTDATQSGGVALLDASAFANVNSVKFELSGGTFSGHVISAGSPTLYGWLTQWNTASVHNGTYTLQSVACYVGGLCGTSPGITITIAN